MMFTQWEYTATADGKVPVVPDGCLDVLIMESATQPYTGGPSLQLTSWDFSARLVNQYKGQKTIGFRLRPGITLDVKKLGDVEPNAESVEQLILEEVDRGLEVCELIHELCTRDVSLQQVARCSGVSVRTLQRHFNAQGLPSPDYWRRLSRVRNAAAELVGDVSIVDIAGNQGFSDQAHMTREFVQWFAVTPNRLRKNPHLLNDICQPGLGNWTTEQISTK